MAELTLTHVVLLTLAVLVGLVAGWLLRGRRSLGEKAAINAGWREQIAARRSEQERLIEQNKSLMEQNSRQQAADRDSRKHAAELSAALEQASEHRDQLQRQIQEIRGSLETALRERDRLQSAIEERGAVADGTAAAINERDARIAQLSKELTGWHDRVPPLIERFRLRNQEALELEERLADARSRIASLEAMLGPEPGGGVPEGNDLSGSGNSTTGANVGGFARDNLKRIKGVGPAIEKTLNDMGIWRFSQIANMSEYEIDRVAERLRGFRSRIYREDWIGQARELEERDASRSD